LPLPGEWEVGPGALSSGLASANICARAGGRRPGGKSGALTPPPLQHVALSATYGEQSKLFAPLADQGSKVIQAEKRMKEEGEREMLEGVRSTLKRWVQECLARDEKRQKLLEKGSMKCRVQAKWSENLHKMMKQLIARYGGKLEADCDKENHGSAATPAWLPRNERWLVSFDIAAFQAYMDAHPEVVEPPEEKVRAFVEEFTRGVDPEAISLKDLFTAMEGRFGTMRQALKDRVRELARTMLEARLQDSAKAAKRKCDAAAPAAKRAKISGAPRVETAQDAAWAAAVLAPLGFKGAEGGGSALAVFCPTVLAGPFLESLGDFHVAAGSRFSEILRTTQLGKIVNGYRNHPKPDVAKRARELVTVWREAACGGRSKGVGATAVTA